MTRYSAQLVLALGMVVLVATPSTSQAGATIKEHDCVGFDTQLSIENEDANCTPWGAEIGGPPGGDFINDEDFDYNLMEGFQPSGAIEVRPRPSNVWQTIPTIKEPNFRQVGFDATMTYNMLLKSGQIVSDLEVTCTVCAERPQGYGPGQTFVSEHDMSPIEDIQDNGTQFIASLNLPQQAWTMDVSHTCSGSNTMCSGQHPMAAKTIPGLNAEMESSEVTFLGCQPTTLLVENPGDIFEGDFLTVRIGIPGTARVSGRFDVTACEVSYLRGCLPGEAQVGKPNVCRGGMEP